MELTIGGKGGTAGAGAGGGAGRSVEREERRARRGRRGGLRDGASGPVEVERKERKRTGQIVATGFQDLRYALRGLRRSPGYAVVAVLTLALAIGATTAIYAVLESVVLDPLPYPDAERLVRIANPVPGVGADVEWQLSPAQYLYFGEHARSLEAMGMYRVGGVNLAGPGEVVRGRAAIATASVFRILGARAALGRLFDDRDDSPGGAPVAVLSHGFWQRQFGGDPDVIGRAIEMNGIPIEVIGVMAPGTELPEPGGRFGRLRTDVWIPYQLDPTWLGSHTVSGIARLAPGATLESAQAELDALRPGLMEAYPDIYSARMFERSGLHTVLRSLKDDVVGDVARNLWILLGAVGLVLLIAAANVANLFLVRIEARRHELAVRAALGASRAAIAMHCLAESVVLSVAGCAVALLLGTWGVEWLVAIAPAAIPRLDAIRVDASVFGFALGVSLVIAVVLAGVAVLRQRGSVGVAALAESGRSATVGRERQRVRSALVVGQVALALILIVGAGLLLESFRGLRAVDPGVDPEGVLTMELYLPSGRYDGHAARWQFYRAMLERVRALPGVTAAGVSNDMPFSGGYGCTTQAFADREVYARLDDAGLTTCAGQTPTSPGYFEALGIPLLAGRTFRDDDNSGSGEPVAVVSRAFAERFWPGEDPIGKRVAPGSRSAPFYRVVGVVGDVYASSVEEAPAVAIYYPIVPAPGSGGWGSARYLVVRTELADPASLFPAIRRIVADLDPAIPLANVDEMQTIVDRSMSRQSFTLALLALAAGVALALAAIGLYGVVSYVVTRRTGEIGVRIALGAQARQVERLVVAGSLRLVLAGLVAGTGAALLLTRLLRGMLFGIEPTDPIAYIAAATLLAGVAGFASWLPARRAARVDPMVALRAE
ncbi:MAG TPA: ABC transporter permease [Longimicrobiales bacterium]